MPRYWCANFSPDDKVQTRLNYGFMNNLWLMQYQYGLQEQGPVTNNWKMAQQVAPGDSIVAWVSQPARFFGTTRVRGPRLPANQHDSVQRTLTAICRNAPVTFRSPLRPHANSSAVTPFTRMPTAATIISVLPSTSPAGTPSIRRWIASTVMPPTPTRAQRHLSGRRGWSCGHSHRCGCVSGDAAPARYANG